MGMYTTLRVDGILKESFVEELKMMLDSRGDSGSFWGSSTIPELRSFEEKDDRSDFIPFGWVHLGGRRNEIEENIERDDCTRIYELSLGRHLWKFICSLKNYEDTIGTWLEDVAPLIFESATIYTWYEESYHPEKYEIISGELVDLGVDDTKGHKEEPYVFGYGVE
jgi:hypothetical protein